MNFFYALNSCDEDYIEKYISAPSLDELFYIDHDGQNIMFPLIKKWNNLTNPGLILKFILDQYQKLDLNIYMLNNKNITFIQFLNYTYSNKIEHPLKIIIENNNFFKTIKNTIELRAILLHLSINPNLELIDSFINHPDFSFTLNINDAYSQKKHLISIPHLLVSFGLYTSYSEQFEKNMSYFFQKMNTNHKLNILNFYGQSQNLLFDAINGGSLNYLRYFSKILSEKEIFNSVVTKNLTDTQTYQHQFLFSLLASPSDNKTKKDWLFHVFEVCPESFTKTNFDELKSWIKNTTVEEEFIEALTMIYNRLNLDLKLPHSEHISHINKI